MDGPPHHLTGEDHQEDMAVAMVVVVVVADMVAEEDQGQGHDLGLVIGVIGDEDVGLGPEVDLTVVHEAGVGRTAGHAADLRDEADLLAEGQGRSLIQGHHRKTYQRETKKNQQKTDTLRTESLLDNTSIQVEHEELRPF